jgi:hypothetical protein
LAKPGNAPPTTHETTSSVPGIDFVQRLGMAYFTMLERQAVETDKVWQALKSGSDVFGAIGSAWATALEGYYDLAVTAWRGPGRTEQPEWVYFVHDPNGADDKETERAPRLRRDVPLQVPQAPGTDIEGSDFVLLQQSAEPAEHSQYQAKGEKHARRSTPYRQCELSADRKLVSIDLDVDLIAELKAGQYMSFVTAKGRSGQTPLVVVVLTVVQSVPAEHPAATGPAAE